MKAERPGKTGSDSLARVARETFFWALVTLLTGYWVLNKSFAYLGFGQLYVSELVLLLGAACLLLTGRYRRLSWHQSDWPLIALVLLFAVWGAARTVPFLEQYGINALRDAVLWGYGAYCILILLLFEKAQVKRFIRILLSLAKGFPILLCAAFIAY